MDDPGNTAAKIKIINSLSEAGVTDPQFIQALVDSLTGSEADLWQAASLAAWHAGPAARAAVPALRRVAGDYRLPESTRMYADWALKSIEEGKPPDNSAAPSPKPDDSAKVAGPDNEVLNASDPDLAASAASHLVLMALQDQGAGTKVRETLAAALPAMMAHYDDAVRPGWRKEVIGFVWLSGAPPPLPLVSKILVALRDNDMAMWATQALAQLKPMPKEVLAAVLAKVKDAPGDIKSAIITALVDNGLEDLVFVQALASILDNPAEQHQAAATALYRLGGAARVAEPALRRFVSAPAYSEDATAQVYAQLALKALGAK